MSIDLSKDHQHIACEKCERVWCAVCVGRVEVKISRQWLDQQSISPNLVDLARRRVAQLNRSLHELSSMNSGRPKPPSPARKVVLGHGASGNAASMKPYVVGFKRRGIEAMAVDLPRGVAERAVPVFIKASGRGREVIGGGQSFGGRVASMAAIEAEFGGLVLFSYPLHRPGFTDQPRTEHFPLIRCPV